MTDIFENLLSFSEAKKIMSKFVKINKTEVINLEKSENRILAEDILSKVNIPEFNNAAVDGFGFINKDQKTNEFKLVGESRPGKPFIGKINQNEAIRVFTGAYILNNIDTICMEENSVLKGNILNIKGKYAKGSNIRIKGEDVTKKQKIFNRGVKIRSIDLAKLSSLGIKKIKVYKKLKVGVFSTGDEICSTKKIKSQYQIYDSNKLALCSLFEKVGCIVFDLGIIRDNFTETKKKLSNKLDFLDIIVTTGGISKSRTDMIGKYFEKNVNIHFWRLSIKPGRPFAFGKIKNTPLISLPGNPVAAVITFFMLVLDYTKKLSGLTSHPIIERILPCEFSMQKKKGRTEWLRGTIVKKKGQYYLKKFPSTGSGIISSISQSEGIIELDEKKDYIRKGSLLKFFRYEDMLN